jgi:transketolase
MNWIRQKYYWSTRLGNAELTIGTTNLDTFAQTLINIAENDRDILVVTSDSRGSGRVTPFAEKYPDQMVEIGIAEQNLVGISSGLSSMGKKVFSVSPACFLTARGLEQIKNDVAYSDQPVKIIGISAGVSYGALGTTHHSLHDFAVLQAINNIDIIAPADNFETREVIQAAVHYPRPLYIRFGKKAMPNLNAPDTRFEIGKAIQLTPQKKEYDITMIAIGETVAPTFLASKILTDQGVQCCVLSLHTLRPFDEAGVQNAVDNSKVVITVEEHSVNGGLGSRVASFLMQAGIFRPLKIVGIPDEHTITGSQGEIFAHYGISPKGLAQTALDLLGNGKKTR